MKIAHIVCTYPPYYGGMGNVVFEMASGLSALGHEVEVLTPDYYPQEEVKPATAEPEEKHVPEIQERVDYATRLKPALQYGNAAYIPRIQNELDRFDLVHLHYPFFGVANLVRRWKLRNPRKPLVITYHMDNRAPNWKGLFFKYYSKFWMPKILGAADKLLVSSLDYLNASDANGLYPDKWIELPFGVDVDRFIPREKPAKLQLRHSVSQELPTVLFVGGMDTAHYFKGVPVLLEALLLLKNNNTPVQAILVGEGDLRSDLMLRSKSFGLDGLVHFVGKVSDEELPYYYNLTDLFVLPSVSQNEAFGMVLLEAMASGVPVVASDLPGVRTVAEDAGFVVPPRDSKALADVIYQFFNNPNRANFGQSLRSLAEEKYAWPVIIKQLEEIYQQLLVV
jgi:glycosyltransferase involved in cell wall biosynthesis